jgi:hypothetical protein
MYRRLKLVIPVLLFEVAFSAHAGYELVCEGSRAQSSQKPIYVDCSDRQAMLNALGSGWKTLRKQGIRGAMEDMCWKPYKRLQEMHPAIPLDDISATFLVQCNIGLEYAN